MFFNFSSVRFFVRFNHYSFAPLYILFLIFFTSQCVKTPRPLWHLERYEEWKTTANKFKQDIKNGLKTNEEFKEWIEKTK